MLRNDVTNNRDNERMIQLCSLFILITSFYICAMARRRPSSEEDVTVRQEGPSQVRGTTVRLEEASPRGDNFFKGSYAGAGPFGGGGGTTSGVQSSDHIFMI
jgi:hypothetical protein